MKRVFLLPLGLLLLIAQILPASTTEWPDYRGPTAQGISEARDVPVNWSREENVEWKEGGISEFGIAVSSKNNENPFHFTK